MASAGTACVWCLCLCLPADPIGAAAGAAAPGRYVFDIAAGPAYASLSTFSSITGVGISWPGGLPPLRLHAVRDTLSVQAALRRLLKGSGYAARQVGPTAYRIVARRTERPPSPLRRTAMPMAKMTATWAATPSADIIVTGQKQPQPLQAVSMSIAVVDLSGGQTGRLSTGTRDVLTALEGVASTNLGPGRNRQFIRGVADSPFNGSSQSTVAVQLDEARVTFDAPDPDLRIVDMDRVEILKGPQGPLYGSGALGGIYHLVTNKPDLALPSGAVRLGSESVAHGGPGGGIDAVVNLPLLTDTLAIRGVGYLAHEGGWIDNQGKDRNANATRVGGARLAVRWRPAPDWTFDLDGVLQDVNTRDSQYVTASDDTIDRLSPIAEPTDNDFKAISATAHGRIGAVDLIATSSYVRHRVDAILNATPSASAFGFGGPTRFTDDRKFRIRNHEARIFSTAGLRWLAGIAYMDAQSRDLGTITNGHTNLPVQSLDRQVREIAAFGEVTVPLVERMKAIVGARLFSSRTEDEAAEQTGATVDRMSKTTLSPSLAVSWSPATGPLLYLRYARAVRPGGLALSGSAATGSARFDADELGTIDLGVRFGDAASRLAYSAAVFQTDWRHIQSDFLLANGLVSTRNAGRGEIYGVEMNTDWRPLEAVSLTLGLAYVDARLVRDNTGEVLDDRRLPVTPDLTLRGVARYRFDHAGWTATTAAQVNYVGRARLSFDPGLDRRMGDYVTMGISALATRSRYTLGVRLDNLLDVTGDSFAFGNPFSIRDEQQFTPIRPRTVSISVGRRW